MENKVADLTKQLEKEKGSKSRKKTKTKKNSKDEAPQITEPTEDAITDTVLIETPTTAMEHVTSREIVMYDLDPPHVEECCEVELDANSSAIQIFDEVVVSQSNTNKSKASTSYRDDMDYEEFISSDEEFVEPKILQMDFSQGEEALDTEKDSELANTTLKEIGEFVPKFMFEKLYPHQRRGVKFLWDNINKGTGCILADFMGMGKTLQTASFLHLFLSQGKAKTVLIVSPASVNTHWVREFETIKKWMDGESTFSITTYSLCSKISTQERKKTVKTWFENGGVMVTSYDMFRTLCVDKDFYEFLTKPGPDVIILDEGHKIKHFSSKIAKTLNTVQTTRRIILTGYPFQNNLLEYWTMINFVSPNFLGEKIEFKRTYSKPIHRGQVSNNINEKRIARRRAWLLYEKVKSLILRRDASLLKKLLPQKEEIMLTISNSDIQRKIYKILIEYLKNMNAKINIFWTYDVIIMLCNHPDVLLNYFNWKTAQIENQKKEKENKEKTSKKEVLESSYSVEQETNCGELFDPPINEDEIDSYLDTEEKADDISDDATMDLSILEEIFSNPESIGYKKGELNNGGKMILLFSVMFQCKSVGDRLIVFSRSINTLNFIEGTLKRYNKKNTEQINFMRFDGSTPFETRQSCIDKVNDMSNNINVLLVSTLAGCEGINLMGANRVALVDVNWNPSHDSEAVCRVFRIGQKKPVYIYRFICENTMEDLVLKRQLQKENLANWIVDDGNTSVDTYATKDLLIIPDDNSVMAASNTPEFVDASITDEVILGIVNKYPNWIKRAEIRDQLLRDDPQNVLTEEEKILAQSENEFDTVYMPKRTYTRNNSTSSVGQQKESTRNTQQLDTLANRSATNIGNRSGGSSSESRETLWLRRQQILVQKETQEANKILEMLQVKALSSFEERPQDGHSSSTSNNTPTSTPDKTNSTKTPPSASTPSHHTRFEKEKTIIMKQLVSKSKSSTNSNHNNSMEDPYAIDLETENTKKRRNNRTFNYRSEHGRRESERPPPYYGSQSNSNRQNQHGDSTKRYKKC